MSIRVRLTLYWAVVLTALVTLAGISVLLLFERQQWAQLDGALGEEADSVAATIERLGIAAAPELVGRLSEERDLGPRRRARLISDGKLIGDYGAATADLPVNGKARRIVNGRRGVFRYAVSAFTLDGAQLRLLDGVDATPIRSAIAHLRRQLLTILPLVLALSVACGYWLAGRALAPIDELITGLARIEPRELERRLAIPAANDEVAQLTSAINQLLERVARAVETERRFAADAAHELRTPVAVLRTGLEVTLGRERSPLEYIEALQSALGEAARLSRIADELLTWSRLEREITVEQEPVKLGGVIENVVEAMTPLVESKQLHLSAQLDREIAVAGNRAHLERVAINLLDNAVKFTPEGGRIELSLGPRDRQIEFRVADDGPAIPEDELPHIFDRFFRSKAAAANGIGLGLSLCREIIRAHRGAIRVMNLPGGGVEFVVTLPRLEASLQRG